jgi:hypothetical protein
MSPAIYLIGRNSTFFELSGREMFAGTSDRIAFQVGGVS